MKHYLFFLFLLLGGAGSVALAQGGSSQTSAPIIHERYSPEPYEMSDFLRYYDFCAIEFENTDDEMVTVYYRYHYRADWDGVETSSDWKSFSPMSPGVIAHVDRDLVLLESAYGWVEVYSVAENKSESEVQRLDFYVDLYPNHHYTRYYDFRDNFEYYTILSDSTVAVSKHTFDITTVFDPLTGYLSVDPFGPEESSAVWYSANPCYWSDVIIPSTVEFRGKTYTVTSIYDYAFEYCDMTSLELPNTLTSIGNCAFYGATISDITIPASVSSVGVGAFSTCYSLTNVVLPGSLDSIAAGAFSHCDQLTDVNIPESVTSIGVGAFLGCDNLTSVTIPESVTSIGDDAFFGCENITSVSLPESVTYIGANAFCLNSLTRIDIPSSVETIGGGAFSCPDLSTVICRAVTPPCAPGSFSRWSEDYLWDTYRDGTLFVPNESLEAYINHEDWSWFMNIVPFIGAGPGDINGDGSIAISDVSSVIDMLLEGDDLPAYCDVNGDGIVSIADVSALIDILLGF